MRNRIIANQGNLVEVYLRGGTVLTGLLSLDSSLSPNVDSRNFKRYFDVEDVVAIGEIKPGATF